jgi:NhaP-type Na+/H+ or K+/H+ antiporter
MHPAGLDPMVVMFGVVGAVVLVAALLSGFAERTRLPHVLVFLALGTAIGPLGLGVLVLGIDSPAIRVIATLGLVLVLFTDAVDVAFSDLRRHARLAALILGPATVATAVVIAFAAWWLLDFGIAESAILGAALASTDPVLLRSVVRSPGMSGPARYALRLESGMNDAVLLPVVLVAMRFMMPGEGGMGAGEVAQAVVALFVPAIGAGFVIGIVGIRALHAVRRRIGVRRDYESLYGFGVAVAAFAAAEALGGSGFLAAFAAGLTIAALDVELCECFFDYGQATAELGLLFSFVTLGSSAIWRGLEAISPAALAFAAVALFVRGPILLMVLARTDLDRRSRLLVSWFGPRGLSSLLLVLLPVFAGVPGAGPLFDVTALVVLLSVIVHGGSQALLKPARAAVAGDGERAGEAPSASAEVVPAAASSPARAGSRLRVLPEGGDPEEPEDHPDLWDRGDPERIDLAGVDALIARGERVVLLDVRTDNSYASAAERARGAVRVPPERAVPALAAMNLPPDAWLVSYCT